MSAWWLPLDRRRGISQRAAAAHLSCGLLTALVVLSTCPRPLLAFKPDGTGGGHAEITREALAGVSRVVGGQRVAFSQEAIEEIVAANLATDYVWYQAAPAYHFDDEELGASSQRLVSLRQEVVAELLAPCPPGLRARLRLGEALHTLQDFYAHSNWVELGNAGINRTLGRTVSTGLPADVPTCKEDGVSLAGAGLRQQTTGWFLLSELFCRARGSKCNHGFLDCPGINKDEPGRPGYPAARALAVAASRDFVEQVLSGVAASPRAVRALLGDEHQVVAVVDTTASMEASLAAVEAQLANLAAAASSTLLVTFGDPAEAQAHLSCDDATLAAAVAPITAFGGGDAPEPVVDALRLAFSQAEDGARVVVATDAPAKSCDGLGSLIELGRLKRLSVVDLPGLQPVGNLCGGRLVELAATPPRRASSPVRTPSWLGFEAVELVGRPGHQGIAALPGFPLAGEPTQVRARLLALGKPSFRLISPSGQVLKPLDLRPGPPEAGEGVFLGSLSWPAQPFRVQALGRDEAGRAYTLTYPPILQGSSLALALLDERPVAAPGARLVLRYALENRGPAADLAVSALAGEGARPVELEPGRLRLAQGQQATVRLVLDLASQLAQGARIPLVVAVERPGETLVAGRLASEVLISRNRAPLCPSPPGRRALWPPDGRMVELALRGEAAATDPDGDVLSQVVTAVTQDEPVRSPKPSERETAPDAVALGGDRVQLRAERVATGNGRVYRVSYRATDPGGFFCTGALELVVPLKSATSGAIDDGQRYDSTQP